VATRFTNEVSWDDTDIIVMGALLFGACAAFGIAARMTGNNACQAAVSRSGPGGTIPGMVILAGGFSNDQGGASRPPS
jgi:hypothetical protein